MDPLSANPFAGQIDHNLVYANSTAGIVIAGSTSASVVNNTVDQPQGDAIQVSDGSNESGEGTVGAPSYDVTISNNILAVAAGYAINVSNDNQNNVTSDYNLFDSTGAGQVGYFGEAISDLIDWYLLTEQDQHSISADPQFVDPAGPGGVLGYDPATGIDGGSQDDFVVSAGSPAIAAGNPTSDYSQQPLPNGGRIELGAFGDTPQATPDAAAGVVIVQPDGATSVAVGGASDSYNVVLSSAPTADVTITIEPDDHLSVSATSLLFTPADWNVAQTVTVSALPDTSPEPERTVEIVQSATSNDPRYQGIGIPIINVTITDNVVSAPSVPIAVNALGTGTVAATEGAGLTATLATFTDPNGTGALNTYSATVNWGDGTATTTGSISGPDADGNFTVTGSHTYAEESTAAETITVVIQRTGSPAATTTDTINVADAPLSVIGATLTAQANSALSGTIATFTDTGGAEPIADYSAMINWGDGTSATAGSISGPNASGVFTISGSHTYASAGTPTITVTVHHDAVTPDATVHDAVTVSSAPLPINATGAGTLAATEGAGLSATLATFTDPSGAGPLGSYSATVNWGDGTSTSTGAISGPNASGVFTVSGSHTYAEESTSAETITVVIHRNGSSSATATDAIDVADAPLAVSGETLAAKANLPLTGTLATFTDSGGAEALSDYSATVNWGDGTNATAGSISGPNASGVFTISGSHTYVSAGTPTITVTVHHDGVTPDVTVNDAVTVSAAQVPVLATGVGTMAATEGMNLSGTLATFTDPNGTGALASYSATINWGDGTSATPGTISGPGSGSTFTVGASHTYAEESTQAITITVVVHRSGSPDATITDSVNVADAPLTGAATASATGGVEGVTAATLSGATFTDANSGAPLTDFSVSAVNWGDGSTSTAGLSVTGSSGSYTVTGSHLYGEEGSHAFTITVKDVGGSTATITGTANVAQSISFSLKDDVYVIGSGTINVSAPNGVLANDSGAQPLTVTTVSVAGVNGGTFLFHADGSFSYTPPGSFSGFDYAQYGAQDTLGDRGTATVYVLSNTGALVWKFYESMLDRDPDDGGLSYWINAFNSGVALSQIAVNFFAGDELQTRVITDYYLQYLGRQPDAGGLAYWKAQWTAAGGPEDVQAGFANSPEFTGQNGDTPSGWVTGLYEKILNRPPEQTGLNYWIAQVEQLDAQDGKSFVDDVQARFTIADRILKSQERYQDIIVPGWFEQFDQRQPTATELTTYVNELLAGTPDSTVEEQIIDTSGVTADVPVPAAGAAAGMPDFYYLPLVEQKQATVAATDAVFSQVGSEELPK
jgi:hypothetical protein